MYAYVFFKCMCIPSIYHTITPGIFMFKRPSFYHHSRCEKKRRLMSGEEQLAVLGYPCRQEMAAAAKVDTWQSFPTRLALQS